MILIAMFLGLVLHGGQDGNAPRTTTANDAVASDAAKAVESLFDADTTRYDDGLVVCVRDGNTLQLNSCVAEDLAAERARMQRYFDLAMEQAAASDLESEGYGERTRQVELLTATQAAWKAYAELRCETQWDEVKGGTIRNIVLIGCWIDATRQRTHDIWDDHLTYWDATPPMLPEPVFTVFEERERSAGRP